jgi:hypothetical protein
MVSVEKIHGEFTLTFWLSILDSYYFNNTLRIRVNRDDIPVHWLIISIYDKERCVPDLTYFYEHGYLIPFSNKYSSHPLENRHSLSIHL